MNQLKQLRNHYIQYLKQNPKALKALSKSCDFLGITKTDLK